jgi:hypothetical protein
LALLQQDFSIGFFSMIDKIKLYIEGKAAAGLASSLQDLRRRDINTYSGHIGNFKINKNLVVVYLTGSLPKYLNGENVSPLDRKQVEAAIKKLETDTGLSLQAAVLCSVEAGVSVILKHKPFEYLLLFDSHQVYGRSRYDKTGMLETVTYTTPTGNYKFNTYDKAKEAAAKRQAMPPLFENCNVLRLEYTIKKRQGLRARFGRDLSAYDLFDYKVYKRLQSLFLREYRAIRKTGRLVYIDKSKQCTPAVLERLCATQFKQSCPQEYHAMLQRLKEAGVLTKDSLKRIRAADRRAAADYAIADTSPLIAELDARVLDYAGRSAPENAPKR